MNHLQILIKPERHQRICTLTDKNKSQFGKFLIKANKTFKCKAPGEKILLKPMENRSRSETQFERENWMAELSEIISLWKSR